MHVPGSGRKCRTTGVHRIIWILNNGSIPNGLLIDHINRVPDDNRIANLRLATHKQNSRNMKTHLANRTGRSGVVKRGNVWCGQITDSDTGKNFHLGTFNSYNEAVAARQAAEVVLWGETR